MEVRRKHQDERTLKFQEISTVQMGNTSVMYCPLPFTVLGTGISATVYPGYHTGKFKATAVKFIYKDHLRKLEEKREHLKELLIWTNIDQNTNIIRLYDSHIDPQFGIFLAMELAERTFRTQIMDLKPPKTDVLEWLYQMASAVEYLHEKGVIHRDIKPDNILMVKKGGDSLVAKLADFGVSKMLSCAEVTSTYSNAAGTLLWRPPEALESEKLKFRNTRKLDIYGLGMTFYFGLSGGNHPFMKSKNEDIFSTVLPRMRTRMAQPLMLMAENVAADDLLLKMMQHLPENRPDVCEVKSHCLFWDWKDEQPFLIRTAICLSRKDCPEIEDIKTEIDAAYNSHYQVVNPGKVFNWIEISKRKDFDMGELLFSSLTRTKPTTEYGNGESVTKFLKLFRDKYVHYTDMKTEAVVKFSENDESFREEKYVRFLTSICPGLVAILYEILQRHANEPSVMPLSELYFSWKSRRNGEGESTKREVCHGIDRDILGTSRDNGWMEDEIKSHQDNTSERVLDFSNLVELTPARKANHTPFKFDQNKNKNKGIHRDLKNANILPEVNNLQAKLADFGVNRPYGDMGKAEVEDSTLDRLVTMKREDFNSETFAPFRDTHKKGFTFGNF